MPDRIIRESICTSDTLNELSDFEERFWHHLIVVCDDYGRFDARPAILKSRLFPLRESLTFKNISDCLARLTSVGLIELYQVDGRPFLRVVTWERYQRIRAKKSKFPAPGDSIHTAGSKKPNIASNVLASDSTCCQTTSNAPVFECECECGSGTREGTAATTAGDPDWGKVAGFLIDNIDQRPSPRCLGDLRGYLRDFGPDLCIRVMEDAMDHGQETRKWSYIDKIFKRLYRENIKTVADFDRSKAPSEPEQRPKVTFHREIIDGEEVDVADV